MGIFGGERDGHAEGTSLLMSSETDSIAETSGEHIYDYIDLIPPLNRKTSFTDRIKQVGLVLIVLLAVTVAVLFVWQVPKGSSENTARATPHSLPCDTSVGPTFGIMAAAPSDAAVLEVWCASALGCIQEHVDVVLTADSSEVGARGTKLGHMNLVDLHLTNIFSLMGLMQSVSPNTEIVNAASACKARASEKNTNITLNPLVFQAISGVSKGTDPDEQTQRYLQLTIDVMRESGVHKSDTVREQLMQIDSTLETLSTTFAQNIASSVNYITVDPSNSGMLAGLDSDFVSSHTNSTGYVIFSTDYTDYVPVMHSSTSETLRRQMYRAFNRRAYPENNAVLQQILQLRQDRATILGYSNYASMATHGKMAANTSRVESFLEEMMSEVIAAGRAELQQLNVSSSAGGVDVFKPYNYGFALNRYIADNFAVNETEVKSYFSTANTKKGVFYVAQELFNIEMRQVVGVPRWHSDVEVYDMMIEGRLIGRAYLDLYPRTAKFKHAAMFPIRQGLDSYQLPEAALVCNFPVAPEAMTFGDVQTFFHEFGHLLHHVIGGQNQDWVAFSGIATEWDFVEAPSQLLEHWPKNMETLSHFARNSDGQLIPSALVDAMKSASQFGRAVATQQQLYYAWFALRLHQVNNPSSMSISDFEATMMASYSPFEHVDYTHMYASFGHLNGYGPLYYTYQWSLAIAQDMFSSEFCPSKMYDSNVAQRYSESILAPGGTKSANTLVTNFLGRSWTADAYQSYLRGGSSSCARHFTLGAHV
eukprot:m.306385 g.306385  ORF g.306385 m.306385 type:complete len:762 (-) comp16345_c0_seq2:1491-3776(-)